MGIYPVPLPGEYFSAFSFCLDCCVLVAFPYSGHFDSSLLWRFLTVGGVVWVACQGFLVREACSVFRWVELDFFSLEFSEVSSSEF